jgi:Uma2 family endonuclease
MALSPCYDGSKSMSVAVTRRRFTVDDYQRMEEAGILRAEDRVELVDGEFVRMMAIGPRHHASVDRANRAFVTKLGESAIVRVQGAVRLDLYNAPEPDLVLLRPRSDFYATRHAGPADVLLILEVAESSIEYDRTVKALLYARADVPEYWVVDLNERILYCYLSPHRAGYRNVREYARGQLLAPQLLPDCVVATSELLVD